MSGAGWAPVTASSWIRPESPLTRSNECSWPMWSSTASSGSIQYRRLRLDEPGGESKVPSSNRPSARRAALSSLALLILLASTVPYGKATFLYPRPRTAPYSGLQVDSTSITLRHLEDLRRHGVDLSTMTQRGAYVEMPNAWDNRRCELM